MSNKKAVVTGGAGFIGSHVARGLLAEGYEVAVVDDLSGGKRERVPEGTSFHEFDVNETEQLAAVCNGAECVFHLAALPRVQFSIEHPQDTHRANVDGTLSVLVAAHGAGVKRVISSSSSSVYGNTEILPTGENTPAHPISPYALHKLVGEQYCRLYAEVFGLPTVSLRYFNVYGEGADPSGSYPLVIAKFLDQRAKGEALTITGDGTQTRDFTHVRDVVRANLLAATSGTVGKGEVINIGAGKNASVNRIAELIGGPVEHVAARLEPHDTLADNARAKELLGWSPEVTLEDGIAELKQLHKLS